MSKRSLAHETLTLIGGNALAQIISVAAYFILTRIYTPADYGLFNIFYSYIEVLVIASTCKYELATIVADSNREAAALSRFALRINTIVSALILAVALLLWFTGSLPQRFQQLGWVVLLIPPMVFFCGTSRIYSFVYNRFHHYKHIALSDNVAAAGGALLKIGLGKAGLLQCGLPVGTVLGQALANINYRVGLKRLDMPRTTAAERWAAARKHKNFPLYVASKDFVSTLSANLPFLWAAHHFNHAEIGLFGLALTFTMQPVNIISSAIERVLYARSTEAVKQHQPLWPMLWRYLLPFVAAAVVACIAAWWIAEPVFVFCFGAKWQGTGDYVRALLPWLFTGFVASTLLYVPNIFGTQRTELGFFIAMLVLRATAVYIGIRTASYVLTVRLFAVASATVYVFIVLWYLYQVRRYERSIRV